LTILEGRFEEFQMLHPQLTKEFTHYTCSGQNVKPFQQFFKILELIFKKLKKMTSTWVEFQVLLRLRKK
jgi:hypothetical protein